MISESSSHAKVPARFAQAPWNEHTAFWRQLDEQLPHDHLAREIRSARMFQRCWSAILSGYMRVSATPSPIE
jgi:hypothetical protein